MKPEFLLAQVECFDLDRRWGFATLVNTGISVFIHWHDVRKPMLAFGRLYYTVDPYDTIPLPVRGDYILLEAIPGKDDKGPRALMWGMWKEFGPVMIREWVKTHDLCGICGHPISGHGLDKYCPDCDSLCGHKFFEPIDFDLIDEHALDQQQEELMRLAGLVRDDYSEFENEEICSMCLQPTVACTCDTREVNVGGSPGGFKVYE